MWCSNKITMAYTDALENHSIQYSYKPNIYIYLLFIFLTFYMHISFLFSSRIMLQLLRLFVLLFKTYIYVKNLF